MARLQRASLRNPVKVEVSSNFKTVDTLIQQYLFIPAKFKVGHVIDKTTARKLKMLPNLCAHCPAHALCCRTATWWTC